MHPDTVLVYIYYYVIAAVPEVTLYEKMRESSCSFIVLLSFQSKKKVFFCILLFFLSSIFALFHFLLAQVRSGHAIRLFSNWGEEGLQQSFGRDRQI